MEAFVRAATELETTIGQIASEPTTLTEAARITGLSADHLGRLIRRQQPPNVGRKHAPRIPRSALANLSPRPRLVAAARGKL